MVRSVSTDSNPQASQTQQQPALSVNTVEDGADIMCDGSTREEVVDEGGYGSMPEPIYFLPAAMRPAELWTWVVLWGVRPSPVH